MKRFACIGIASILILASCGRRGVFPPVGSYSDIMLVTETGKIEGITELMVRELQYPIDYYTKEELQFRVKVVPAVRMEKEAPAKNMVICGVVRQGDVGGIIESFIGTSGVREVLEGRHNIFKKTDFPSPGQLTVIVTASSRNSLKNVIATYGYEIRDIIEESNRERLRAYLLQKKERIDLSEKLRAQYGFSVRIPHLYELNQERAEVPGIEIVRLMPHRGLTVSWHSWKSGEPSVADSTGLFELRARLAWEMYDKDVMRRELVSFTPDKLGPYDTVRMDGYWENTEGVYGGPFVCFFVYDRIKSRLWMVDCVVYAPGFNKHTLLRELRAVAETFRLG
ncbi:MAG: DUF4837 family protein [bacterium]|nr:MAG: DUF4837 family protein [bacterium]